MVMSPRDFSAVSGAPVASQGAAAGLRPPEISHRPTQCTLLHVDVPLQRRLAQQSLHRVAALVHAEQLRLADGRPVANGVAGVLGRSAGVVFGAAAAG
jgi:hypothetical protein